MRREDEEDIGFTGYGDAELSEERNNRITPDIEADEGSGTSKLILGHYDISMYEKFAPSDLKAEKQIPRVEKMYADMQSDKAWVREMGENAFASELEGIIKGIISKYYAKYAGNNGADMFQEAFVYCFKNRFGYNPEKGAFSTYFTFAARTAIKTYIGEYINHETRHEAEIDGKVHVAIRDLSAYIDESEVTVPQIQQLTGLSFAVVQASLYRIRHSAELSLDDTLASAQTTADTDPATLYRKDEESREFWDKAAELLDEEELKLLKMRFLEGKEKEETYRILGLSPEEGKYTEKSALKKLSRSKYFRKFAGVKDRSRMTDYDSDSKDASSLNGASVKRGSFFDDNIEDSTY